MQLDYVIETCSFLHVDLHPISRSTNVNDRSIQPAPQDMIKPNTLVNKKLISTKFVLRKKNHPNSSLIASTVVHHSCL